ncbi:LuxR family two component transcriptional regulator [Paucimonas lemoignei]|uniref:LuxR family two component transcriptional regulator n=1 Tax=Paucimonas lemoignei TaxID=29443 RepID=A0A4R3HZ56_PAULE|nr:response regulator transcription factor [Paucimonas lemoignei]TCS38522.1 LuxR family two component transcriptional regulator [Paucimonas lemoignei]
MNASADSFQPIRVLIVEDDAVTRTALSLSIQAEPTLMLAGAFDSMQPALEWMHTGAMDVLLTDLGLPDGSGVDVIRACRRLHPHCDIMVLTMSANEADVVACIEAGACGYLLKDGPKNDIARSVLSMREGGSPMSPLIARMVLERIRAPKPSPAPHEKKSRAVVQLTKREIAILDLIARGETYGNIATMLSVSVGTVQTHIKSIYSKLSVHSRGEAVFEAQRRGLLKRNAEST